MELFFWGGGGADFSKVNTKLFYHQNAHHIPRSDIN